MSSPTPLSLKTGRLSKEEQAEIRQNAELSDDELAKRMNRRVEAIKEYRKNLPVEPAVLKDGRYDNFNIKTRPEWKSIQKQFQDHELDVFEYEWNRIIAQFHYDVTATEELQIQSLIATTILLGRNLENARECMDQIVRLQKLKNDLEAIPKDARPNDWITNLENLEQQIAGLRQSTTSYTGERVKLEQSRAQYLSALKATRDQRKILANEGATNWPNLLRMLEERDNREREGRAAALIHIAARKELERLGEAHKFANGEYDRPFLNAETVGWFDEDNTDEDVSPTSKSQQDSENVKDESRPISADIARNEPALDA